MTDSATTISLKGKARLSAARAIKTVPSTVLVAAIVALLCVAFAVVVPLIAPDEAVRVDPGRRFEGASASALLGRDHLGRDLAVMIALGLRTSLLVAVIVVAVAGFLGWLIGAISAYSGGRIDSALSRVMDSFNAFPGLIMAISLVTALGQGFGTLAAVLVVATWVNYARVVRSRVLSLKNEEFVVAARMYGASRLRILSTHIWPNTLDLVAAIALVQIPNVMLAESTISFLGFGLQPPDVSLGLLITTEKDYLQTNGFPVIAAGAFLVAACSSIASLGLYLRQRLR